MLLPGLGRGSRHDYHREPVPGPRDAPRRFSGQHPAHAGQEEDAGNCRAAYGRSQGGHPFHDTGGGDALGRSAPVRGGGPRRGLRAARGHPGRTDRRAGREGRQHGAGADPPRARQGPARDPDQPQHAARVRDRRPHPHRPSGQARLRGQPQDDQHERHGGGDDGRARSRDAARGMSG